MENCHILVSGRWDNIVSVIDLRRALDPKNDGTPKAIINRVRVTPDIDSDGDGIVDTAASGQPVSIAVPKAGRYAYVVNHSGRATPAAAAAFQHGHPGVVTVLDLVAALDPASNGTTKAIADLIATGMAGPVGIAITPDDKYVLRHIRRSRGTGGRRRGGHSDRHRQPQGRAPHSACGEEE